jgi:hypothetical protein
MRLFKCSILNLFLFSFFYLSNVKLLSSQILNIINSKEDFPILKAKNIRDVNTLIKTDKNNFVHSYDEELELKNNIPKSSSGVNIFPFPQTLNEDEITFLQNNISEEKVKIRKIHSKEKKIIQKGKQEILELENELNNIKKKSQLYRKIMDDFKSIDYKGNNMDNKLETLKKLNQKILDMKSQLNKSLNQIIQYFDKNRSSEYFKSINKAEVSENLNVKEYSKFDKILLNELSLGDDAFKISSAENYIRIEDDNTNFVRLIEVNKIIEELNNRCGENFKKCFMTNVEIKNKNQELVKINI